MINILFDSAYGFGFSLLIVLVLILALIMAFTLHEFAHAYVALLNGDRTAQLNGRVSLNPLRHIDPIGFAMVVIAGFGYARPVPVNPSNFRKRKWGMFSVSIAGVTVNLILSIISGAIYAAVYAFAPESIGFYFLLTFLYAFHSINLTLCFFNLIPIFPLDGFNMIASFLSPRNRFVMFMRKYGQYIFILLIGLSFIVDYFDRGIWWWRYFDILGTYLNFTAGNVSKGILWLFGKMFGVDLVW